MTRAFVFPGQGSQSIGMGKELADQYPAARMVFEEVDEALGERLSALIWEGEIDTLSLTANAQPALMAASMATVAALAAEGVNMDSATWLAGHSLGEYSALAAGRAISIFDTARLLRLRGKAMQEAVPVGEGAMAAILGLDIDAVRQLAADAAEGEVCEAANDNDPQQVVVSGHKTAVERAFAMAKDRGAKRALMLTVSAPFHCSLMGPAAEAMEDALARTIIRRPLVPVVANVSCRPVSDPDEIRSLLVQQVTGAVRWRESVAWMAGEGISEFVELGAGRALSGMIRRIAPGRDTAIITDVKSLIAFTELETEHERT